MTKHLNDGQLRAALDGEAAPAEIRHLKNCPGCEERERVMGVRVQQAAGPLAFLAPAGPEPSPDARTALGRFRHRILSQKETSMFKKIFASPLLRYGLAVLFVLALIVTIPGTRALADQLLSLFRVEQVAVVPIDFTGMQQLTGDGPLGKQMSQLLSNSVTITQKPGKPQQAADAGQASKLAGFAVRLPQGKTPSRISVLGASGFTFTIDRAKAQAVLDEAGRNVLVLPASINGEQISAKIPAAVSVAYGTCPEPTDDTTAAAIHAGGSAGRNYADCVILAEIPSPTVDAPADVNISQLAQIGLEFTGMSSDQAAAFTNSVDWTSTLVIPIPKNAATYKQLPVDGVTATLIERPADDAPQFLLVWIKNGIVYSIGGLGSNSQQAIDMANSLH